jgi:hypothetical protein
MKRPSPQSAGKTLGLKREWLDEDERAVHFPDTKSGAQTRVIGRAAVDLLLGRICALAGLADVTPNSLRHTFASVAGDLGFSELTIAALLKHAARGVTQRYVHIDEALRMAADKVAQEIAMVLNHRAYRARAGQRDAAPADLIGTLPSHSGKMAEWLGFGPVAWRSRSHVIGRNHLTWRAREAK